MSCNKGNQYVSFYFFQNGIACNPERTRKMRCEAAKVICKKGKTYAYQGKKWAFLMLLDIFNLKNSFPVSTHSAANLFAFLIQQRYHHLLPTCSCQAVRLLCFETMIPLIKKFCVRRKLKLDANLCLLWQEVIVVLHRDLILFVLQNPNLVMLNQPVQFSKIHAVNPPLARQ